MFLLLLVLEAQSEPSLLQLYLCVRIAAPEIWQQMCYYVEEDMVLCIHPSCHFLLPKKEHRAGEFATIKEGAKLGGRRGFLQDQRRLPVEKTELRDFV